MSRALALQASVLRYATCLIFTVAHGSYVFRESSLFLLGTSPATALGIHLEPGRVMNEVVDGG